ncbi:MAG: nucleotidyltransferase domain-containing protein [Pyrinomonadaceae bacterium]
MDVQAHIKRVCSQIVERFRPQKVILFGSYAYGTPTANSDIDLLVVMPFDGRVHEQAVKIRRELDSSFPLDLLVRTPEQIRERVEMEDFFMREIVEQGKVLYEENDA